MGNHLIVPCEIRAVGRARNGRPRFWCIAHQADATPDDCSQPKCKTEVSGSNTSTSIDLDPREYQGGVALWGAVPPIYDTTKMQPERGVHLHARRSEGDEKEIDDTFDVVNFPYKRDLLKISNATVTGRSAAAFYLANFVGNKIDCVFCSHCGEPHLDEGEFAFKLHKRHLCHACGRYFAGDSPCVSNPLALLRDELNSKQREPRLSSRNLQISQADYPGGAQLWASNPAIIWLANRSEEAGIHVHLYDHAGKRVVDDTFGNVEIDGVYLPNDEVAYLMAQQTAPWLSRRIVSLDCTQCATPLFNRGRLAFEPSRELACSKCKSTTVLSGRRNAVVSNPLVAKLDRLRQKAVRGVDERLYIHHGHQH